MVHSINAAPLIARVTDSQYLVHNQDFGLEMSCDRECESHVHAARESFHWRVQKPLNFAERDDLVKLRSDFAPTHPKKRSVQVDIFTPGEFWMKASANLEEASQPAAQPDPALGGLRDVAQDFQERRFARTVSADNSERFTRLHHE